MKIRILILAIMFALPIGANAAWYEGVIPGLDVWTVDSAASNWETAVATCQSIAPGGFLPTAAHLDLMYTNEASLGTFGDVDYWSATSFDSTNAYRKDFLNGSTDYGLKSLTEDVRCVRVAPMTYTSADVAVVGTEITDMYETLLPPVALVFAVLFSVYLIRRLVKSYLAH